MELDKDIGPSIGLMLGLLIVVGIGLFTLMVSQSQIEEYCQNQTKYMDTHKEESHWPELVGGLEVNCSVVAGSEWRENE